MVVHSRAHKLSESVIGPLPHPAVNDHSLCAKADRLSLKVPVLIRDRCIRTTLPMRYLRSFPPFTSPLPHLHSFQHIPEDRPLLPLVCLGAMFVAVSRQSIQLVTQQLPVFTVKVLYRNTRCSYKLFTKGH